MDQFDLTMKLEEHSTNFIQGYNSKIDNEFYNRVQLLAKNITLPPGFRLSVTFGQTDPNALCPYTRTTAYIVLFMAHQIDGEPESLGLIQVHHFDGYKGHLENIGSDFSVVETKIHEIIATAPDYSDEIEPEIRFSRRVFS